jgi:hypothetical protein
MNPLEYGKLIKQIDNIYITQFKDKNAIITQLENANKVEIKKLDISIYDYVDK